jgi:hypothetical protein
MLLLGKLDHQGKKIFFFYYVPIWWEVLHFWRYTITYWYITISVLCSTLENTKHSCTSPISVAIRSRGLKYPFTAEVYCKPCNMFLQNTKPAQGQVSLPVQWMKLCIVSVSHCCPTYSELSCLKKQSNTKQKKSPLPHLGLSSLERS